MLYKIPFSIEQYMINIFSTVFVFAIGLYIVSPEILQLRELFCKQHFCVDVNMFYIFSKAWENAMTIC